METPQGLSCSQLCTLPPLKCCLHPHNPKSFSSVGISVLSRIQGKEEKRRKENTSQNIYASVLYLGLRHIRTCLIERNLEIHLLSKWTLVSKSRSVVSNSLRPHGLQHVWPPCPTPTPGIYSNSCPLSRWCHPTISSSVVPFSSHLQSFPASGSFLISQFFTSVDRVLEVQHQSFQRMFRTDLL